MMVQDGFTGTNRHTEPGSLALTLAHALMVLLGCAYLLSFCASFAHRLGCDYFRVLDAVACLALAESDTTSNQQQAYGNAAMMSRIETGIDKLQQMSHVQTKFRHQHMAIQQ